MWQKIRSLREAVTGVKVRGSIVEALSVREMKNLYHLGKSQAHTKALPYTVTYTPCPGRAKPDKTLPADVQWAMLENEILKVISVTISENVLHEYYEFQGK